MMRLDDRGFPFPVSHKRLTAGLTVYLFGNTLHVIRRHADPGVGEAGPVRITAVVTRVERTTRRLSGLVTVVAVAGGLAGVLLWWSTSGSRIHHLDRRAAASLVVLGVCLVPSGWLLNVRFALLALLRLPATLGDVATRRGTQLVGATGRGPSVGEYQAGWLATVGSLRGAVRDYGDVVGSWATVAQLVTPTFWALTALALLAVPILVAVAAAATLVAAFT